MINFERNNLDKATSPYLLEHKDNPVYWQEWSAETIAYARQQNKLIFVSTGYSTCHWCHVMAHEAFSDSATAQFLNTHCVSIKVDREQRPDIDQYFVFYAVQTQGAAGWPLNVICTPELNPFIAFTFLPAQGEKNSPTLLKVAEEAKKFYDAQHDSINAYQPPIVGGQDIPTTSLVALLEARYDTAHGGFEAAPKFPPHSTLIFLLHYFERTNNQHVFSILKQTLDAMATRGLHDHLQGGFFRYCGDDAWNVPHFEKMLYDQGLMLWNYSVAYKVLKEQSYKTVAEKIINCLTKTFENNGLYYAGHDADTDGKEGATYVWSKAELKTALTEQEFAEFCRIYVVSDGVPADAQFTLIKSRLTFAPELEQKLLAIRNKRHQPAVDSTIITSWNALTGIGLCMAARYLDNPEYLKKAEQIFTQLLKTNVHNGALSHSSIDGVAQKEGFLEDYGAMLLLATYVYEDTQRYKEEMVALRKGAFALQKEGVWYEAITQDFMPMPAQPVDHTMPGSVSMLQYALIRTAFLLGEQLPRFEHFKEPLQLDFYNLTPLALGNFNRIAAPIMIPWESMPLNTMQRRGATFKRCIGDACAEFKTLDELLNALTL